MGFHRWWFHVIPRVGVVSYPLEPDDIPFCPQYLPIRNVHGRVLDIVGTCSPHDCICALDGEWWHSVAKSWRFSTASGARDDVPSNCLRCGLFPGRFRRRSMTGHTVFWGKPASLKLCQSAIDQSTTDLLKFTGCNVFLLIICWLDIYSSYALKIVHDLISFCFSSIPSYPHFSGRSQHQMGSL